MSGDLFSVKVSSLIRNDDAMMDLLGGAMYSIRAPQKSKRIAYESLSRAQRLANQNVAMSLIETVSSQRVSTSEELVEALAKELYSHLAPQKSKGSPWNSRSEFHHSWYRTQAITFVTALANGLSSNQSIRNNVNAQRSGQRLAEDVLVQRALDVKSKVSLRSLQSTATSPSELRALQAKSGETLRDLGEEIEVSTSSDSGAGQRATETSRVAATSGDSNNSEIVSMLGCIALLLVILIIVIIVF